MKNTIAFYKNKLKNNNYKRKVKIRLRELDDSFSFYLDMKINGVRKTKTLKLHLFGKQKTKNQDSQNYQLALMARDKMERKLMNGEYNLNKDPKKILLIEYAIEKIDSEIKASYTVGTMKHLKGFIGNSKIYLHQVDRSFCQQFRKYIPEQVSKNAAHSYFKVFKRILKIAVVEKLIKDNPAEDMSIKQTETKREYLTEEEIKIIMGTNFKNKSLESVKLAFLFSCFTGIRLSDVKSLTHASLDHNRISFKQRKTSYYVEMKLNQNAIDIMNISIKLNGENKEHLFAQYSNAYYADLIKKIINKSSIQKNITFHSSRHTFATLLITNNADLYAVSKLLGHKNIAVTQRYAKLIDKKLDEAIDLLPHIV